MKSSTMSAEKMGIAAEIDPQFQLPRKPRMTDGFQVVPITRGLLVHGGESMEVFRGQAASHFLPQFIPLLDGTKTLDDLATHFPSYSPLAIKNVLALLFARGLLEDGIEDEGYDMADFDPEVLAFFRRHTDLTRVNRSAVEGLNRLKQQNVILITDVEQGKSVQKELLHVGVKDVQLLSMEDEIYLQDITLVLVFLAAHSRYTSKLQELDRVCGEKGIPWLLSMVDGENGVIGPYLDRSLTGCYDCFQANLKWEPRGIPLVEYIDWWAQFTSMQVTYLLSRMAPSMALESIIFDFDKWSQKKQRLVCSPGCPNCMPMDGLNAEAPEIAYCFEKMIAFPPKDFLDPKAHQMHYKSSNITLSYDSKEYPSSPVISLPGEGELVVPKGNFLKNLFASSPEETKCGPLTLAALSRVLVCGAGLRAEQEGMKVDDKLQRWAPTGGNLGSTQIYVLARTVDGLQSGAYFYQIKDHELARIGASDGMQDIEALMSQVMGESPDRYPDALIVLTGALHRVATKYHAFAYKVIHLDAGVAMTQMQAVASGLGLSVTVYHTWEEEALYQQLQVNEIGEPITAIFALRGEGGEF